MGFGPGDEAIVPALTWISTANVVEHLGTVVFCDIDLATYNIDVKELENKITEKTKAILPVHLFGFPADIVKIRELAARKNIKVIEDAACGFGSYFNDQHVGTFGDAGCFSFHPRKSITTGEGGMITTNDSNLAAIIRSLRDHGAAMSDLQRHLGPQPFLLADHPFAGFNQRMTDIQAALGAAQMDRANEIVLERRQLAKKYDEFLESIPWLKATATSQQIQHGYQSYPCLYKHQHTEDAARAKNHPALTQLSDERNLKMQWLLENGISTRPATHCVHTLAYYREKYSHEPMDFPNAFAAANCSISLPLFNGMTASEQSHITKVLALG